MHEHDICHAGIVAGYTVTFYGKLYILPAIDYLVADEFIRDLLIIVPEVYVVVFRGCGLRRHVFLRTHRLDSLRSYHPNDLRRQVLDAVHGFVCHFAASLERYRNGCDSKKEERFVDEREESLHRHVPEISSMIRNVLLVSILALYHEVVLNTTMNAICSRIRYIFGKAKNARKKKRPAC